MSGFASRSALIGSSFLVLALASPSFAQSANSYGATPGVGQAKAQMVHMRGQGRRGMIPVAQLVCGDDAAAKTAAFQANLSSGLNLSAEQQDLVAKIIAAVTADEAQVERMCQRLDRMKDRMQDRMAERGDDERGWGRRGHGWGSKPGHMHGHMDGGHMDGEMHDGKDGDEQAHMQRPGMHGPEMKGHGMNGFGRPGHHGHQGDHAKRGPGGPKGPFGPMALERLLDNPALDEADRTALEGILEKLKTAGQAKQKARHELRGLMMEFRHSLSKEQVQSLRKGGFQQFLPDAPKA